MRNNNDVAHTGCLLIIGAFVLNLIFWITLIEVIAHTVLGR